MIQKVIITEHLAEEARDRYLRYLKNRDDYFPIAPECLVPGSKVTFNIYFIREEALESAVTASSNSPFTLSDETMAAAGEFFISAADVARYAAYLSDIARTHHLTSPLKMVMMQDKSKIVMKKVFEQPLDIHKLQAVRALSDEIDERKEAENGLFRLNRLYAVLSKVNEAIVRIHTPRELYESVCRIAVEDGLFKIAWIGLLDTDTLMVTPVASYGDIDGYLKDIKIYANDVPEGKGPTGMAVIEGKYSISGDIEHDPRMLPWRDKLLRRDLRASAAFPIHTSSGVIGALTVYAEEAQFFTDEEIHLLLSLTDDISFTLDSMSTEKKRLEAEEALRRINEELEQRVVLRTADLEAANKELEAFSYSVSHDLRAPLRHMSAFVDLLEKKRGDQLDETTSKYTTAIATASKKMGMLIDDLLTFSKIGRTEMQKRKVVMNSLVRGVVREIKAETKGRDIVWDITEMPDVYGDQSLLRLVLVNLISNAVKYTSTCIRAEIRIGCKDKGSEIICSVKDNGVGFDMKHVDKLFGVFQRLHTEDEFEGTGIGLANVQRIIARHSGRTWAEGAIGQGATFYFALPKEKEREWH